MTDTQDFDSLDHPDDVGCDPLTDEEAELFPLFADALDPNTPTTVEERATEWQELFG